MGNQSNKLTLLNSRLIKLLVGTLLIGLPIFTTTAAKADMHQESMPNSEMGVEMDTTESENTGGYNNSDGGYDGEPAVTLNSVEDTINIMLKNNTNAAIDYQAIGYTENQTLEGGKEHTLKDLPVPVVIRAARQDDGFIKTIPMVNESGMLEVSLDEASERNLGVVRIEEDGGVYIGSSK